MTTQEPAMSRTIIQTDKAPAAIGPYSQAVRVGQTVYLSGQIPLLPDLGERFPFAGHLGLKQLPRVLQAI